MKAKTNRRQLNNHCRDLQSLLRSWLAERQLLLSLYCELSAKLKSARTDVVMQKLDRLCEILVDYVGAGHFEVYGELFDIGQGRASRLPPRIRNLYAQIMSTTAVALDFNDRYISGRERPELAEHLSLLGQTLAIRFDWEDELIRQLYLPARAAA